MLRWWQILSAMALAATSSPNTLAHPPMPTLVVMIVDLCSYRVLTQLDEQVGAALVDVKVSQLVDDEQFGVGVVL